MVDGKKKGKKIKIELLQHVEKAKGELNLFQG